MPRNDLLLRSLRGQSVERFPVWLMRQAGRYMSEYRELRGKKENFLELCKDVELATRITLLPLELLGVDALIIFSDILVPLEGMGVRVEFVEGEGPRVYWSGRPEELKPYEPSANEYVYEIVRRVKELQDEVPVIGFGGAPFTLFSYLVEGGPSKDFRKTKLYMWERPKDFKRVMSALSDMLVLYLREQVRAGADVIQLFDSWSMHLSVEDYNEYVYPFTNYVISELKAFSDVPVIYFFRGSCAFMDIASDYPADALSVDWSVDIPELFSLYDKAFQGNLEPSVLYADAETIRQKTLSLLRRIPVRTRYVFNLGHGLLPDMDFEKVKFLVDTVKSFRLS
ncbi:MAG: uroporphyrinogen decarboxylase [Aquificae bacterium]|nr:uroporphyrinogen decarboxylase [Aquificota bacterium]